MNRLLISIIIIFISFNSATAAKLFCENKEVDMEKVTSSGSDSTEYVNELFKANCGIEAEICFTGKDSDAYLLLYSLNITMYENSDDVRFYGVYFPTGNRDNVKLRFSDTGQYGEEYVYRCGSVHDESFFQSYQTYTGYTTLQIQDSGYMGESEEVFRFTDTLMDKAKFTTWYNSQPQEHNLYTDADGHCEITTPNNETVCSINFDSSNKTVTLTIYVNEN